MDLYVVRQRRGGPWDWARGLREQEGFGDHARFMDGLVESGLLLLGGPLGGDRETLLVFSLPEGGGEDAAEAVGKVLADDPWIANGMLTVLSVERWTILLDGR